MIATLFAFARRYYGLATKRARPTVKANESVAFIYLVRIEPLTIVGHRQREKRSFDSQVYRCQSAFRMANKVINRLLEHQKDLASKIRSKLQIESRRRRVEGEFNVARRQRLTGHSPHPAYQIAKVIPLRIYRPYNIAYRIERLLRDTVDQRKIL